MPEIKVPSKGSVSESLSMNVFREILLNAIKDGMQFLGESARKAIYVHIQKRYAIKQDEYPERLETFHAGLREIFGVGTEILERHIAKSLYSRLGLDFREEENWTIIDYVEEAKRIVMSFV